MATIVVVDPLLGPARDQIARELGPEHDVVVPASWSWHQVATAVEDADVLLTATQQVTLDLMSRSSRLRLVAKPGAGLDNVDVDAATRRGVLVSNAPGARGGAVAEHVLWAVLTLAKSTGPAESSPGTPLALDLAGRTMGLVGLGDIGSRVALAADALGMPVVAATPSRINRTKGVDVRFTGLSSVHRECDVLVLCAPLVPTTRGLLDATRLREMRPDALLVNVARGQMVVTDALVEVLADGHLHGAALDVTDPEPLPAEHPLRSIPNVVLTPHVAGRTVGAQRAALSTLMVNVTAHLRGDRPPHAVNADAVLLRRS